MKHFLILLSPGALASCQCRGKQGFIASSRPENLSAENLGSKTDPLAPLRFSTNASRFFLKMAASPSKIRAPKT
jgi:hypothetical protein